MKTRELQAMVKEIMERENWTLERMAVECRCSWRTVDRWLKGESIPRGPKLSHLRQLFRKARQNHPDDDVKTAAR